MISSSFFDFSLIYAQLTNFAKLSNFWSLFDTAFGSSYDSAKAAGFKSQWQSGNFSQFPQIEIVSSGVLGSANGAYAISTNKIYLSDRFVSSASQQSLDAVILEEFGHFVDAQVNAKDTPGDEGELFSDLVRGVKLSPSELTRIQTEDDHAIISLDGQLIPVEEAFGNTGYIQFGSTINGYSASGINTDGSSNIYIIGNTFSSDAFIAKYDVNGSQVWLKQFGTPDSDSANGIIIDSNGNAYIAGSTGGTFSGNNRVGGYYDTFIAKYNAEGNQVWVKQYASVNDDSPSGITIDNNGNLYVAGSIFNLPNNVGYDDVYVAKYDASGNQVWLKQFGQSNKNDKAYGISADHTGNVYITGTLDGDSFFGGGDIFIAKYDANGSQAWLKQFGTSSDDKGYEISTDSHGNIYVTGTIGGNIYSGNGDVFIAKYDTNGSQLWIKQFGTSQLDEGLGISIDSNDFIYVTGKTSGSLSGNINLGGYSDAFVAKYDTNGTQIWVKQFGSSGSDSATAISADSSSNVLYTAGSTDGSLPGNSRFSVFGDAFVAGFDANGNLLNTSNLLPSITLKVSLSSVTEDGTANLVYTFTRTGSTASALTVKYNLAGTATVTDYTGATPGTGKTITFNPGSATATLTIDPTADALTEPNETVILTLATGTGYTVGTTTGITGTITNDDTAIETAGNVKFIKDGGNKYFAQVGTVAPITIKNGGQQIYKDIYSSDWQTLAVENVNGENQVLWKHVPGNFLHIWKMDSNWNRVSSEGNWALNSTEAFKKETLFGVDANGDGSVGNSVSLNLTGTSANDTLIGGAKNDVLKGLGGKDILTGGLGSDRFDYTTLTDSLLANFDVITDFNANASNDLLLVTTARSVFTNVGTVATLDNTGIIAKLNTTNFGINAAAQFTFGSRNFVAINNGTAGFSQTTDVIIEITGLTGTLGLTNFVTV